MSTPQAGGEFTFATAYDAKSRDPQRNLGNGAPQVLQHVYDSLTDQDPKTGKLTPWLAESWQQNADLTEFTFTLRPGVTFSDGTPLDATAVKVNFDRIPHLGATHNLAAGYLEGYRETRVIDPLKFAVVFDHPTAQFLQATSTLSLAIISPQSALQNTDDRKSKGTIGSGPFVITDYTPDKSYTLEKRKDYAWPSSRAAHTGPAYLDKITVVIVPESGVRAGVLASGQVDGADMVRPQDQAQFDGNGFFLSSTVAPGLAYSLAPNESRPIVKDQAIRRAIQYGIDRSIIVDTILQGAGQKSTSVLTNETPGWIDLAADFAYDPEKSKTILDQAGWMVGPDGIREKDGQKLSLYLPFDLDEVDRLTLVQGQLRDIGIDLKIEKLDGATFDQKETENLNDFTYTYWKRADPDILRFYLAHDLSDMNKVANPDVEDVLQRQSVEPDIKVRNELVAQAQKLVIDDAHLIPLWDIIETRAYSQRVHDPSVNAAARVNFYDTWIG
ncbi:ABC transporter substrate-binding protein [Mycobacterium sp. BMJ-28]